MFLLLMGGICLTAWGQRPFVDDFTLSGDTYLTEDYCFRLTEAYPYRSGSIWYKYPVDLSQSFRIELSIMAGCEDAGGADGMVFVFASQANRQGYVGEGIGFAGLVPSVGIEIDTWRNEHLYDPSEDHLALLVNGRVGHFTDIAEPWVIPNLEDCTRHRLVISWQSGSQVLSVYIDGVERMSSQINMAGSIFGGNPKVYWGVTAATGRYFNIHEVCFDRLSQVLPKEADRDVGKTEE